MNSNANSVEELNNSASLDKENQAPNPGVGEKTSIENESDKRGLVEDQVQRISSM